MVNGSLFASVLMASSQSSHRRWSGCPLCKGYKYRDAGQSTRKPWAELRVLGKKRRVSRHDGGIVD